MVETIQTIFSERLKFLRTIRGLSQERLAKKTGLKQAMISKYESGHDIPTAFTLLALASALDCSVEYLLGVREEDL